MTWLPAYLATPIEKGGAGLSVLKSSAYIIPMPPSGKPLILMNDRQTTGGYAQIAQIIQADKAVLGQSRCGSVLRFQKVSLETAWAEVLALEKELNASLERL